MKQNILHLNRYKSVRLFVPVFLGFVILTASANLPDFDEAAVTFKNSSAELPGTGTTLINEESGSNQSRKAVPVVLPGRALGWGSTSQVVP